MLCPSRPLAPTLAAHDHHSITLTEADLRAVFEYYRDDNDIREVDAFVCGFPASLCEVFASLNKTLIFYPYHRILLGQCSADSWARLTRLLVGADEWEGSTTNEIQVL